MTSGFARQPIASIAMCWHVQNIRLILLLSMAFIVALFATPGEAQERSEDECFRLQPDIVSSVEVANCTSDIAGSGRELAKALAELRARVPVDHQRALTIAQRAWAANRDAQCAWEAGGNPGSTGHDAAIIACTADMNRQRAEYLRADLKDRW
ncbi:lysozyme inhibitor LprI family protein [Sphingobium aquiterrae]|uniref:lysozyme inhibitor LprI family protein n=1 Tax=Sphingobium aquiterrae TaxID=2038656 RepID=UPI00301AC314